MRSGAQEAKALSWSTFLSTYLPALVLALGTGIALPAIPTLAKSFHVGFGLATAVTTSFLIGNVAGTLPSGWLVDRFGRRRIMLFGPLLTAAVAFLVATSQTFPELIICRFFDGCAAQMWLVGRLAGISHGAAANQRGKQTSWMFGMNNTGNLFGPTIGGFIAADFGVRAPFWTYGFLALLALIPAFMFAPDTPRLERAAQGSPVRAPTIREIVRPRLPFFGVALFAGLTRGPVSADLLHLYAAYAYHLGPEKIGYLATSAAALSLPIGFIAGWMMDRYGRKRTMVPGFTGVVFTMTGLAIAAFVHLPFFWYVVIFLTGITAQSLTGGSVQTVGADVAPADARGKFLGIWRFAGQGGTSLSPIIFATLASTLGYGYSFVFIAMCAAVVATLLIRVVPETGAGGNRQVVTVVPALPTHLVDEAGGSAPPERNGSSGEPVEEGLDS
jgi:MFS family permease